MPKTNRETQADKLLAYLQAHNSYYVPAYKLAQFSLSYTRRIHELRKAGHDIRMIDNRIHRQRCTAYRWFGKAA